MDKLNAPKPKSPMGYYRLLAPSAAVRVSPLCLGTMNFGNAWKDFMGACDKVTVNEILDYFYEQGGNFIDTANNYQREESEMWIGEWMEKRGVRDQMVIATKYTTSYRATYGNSEIVANTAGNGTKSLHTSVANSLKKLRTDYIDILYVHWWDHSTSIPEMMQSLNVMVTSGKVLYLGASDLPAWVVSKANEYARANGLRQFSVYQGRWSAEHRDFERDIIPMCRAEGMGIAPWGALGQGHFKAASQRGKEDGRKRGAGPSEAAIKISDILEKIGKAKNVGVTSVALAYVMNKTTHVFPIVGGRTIEHLKGNVEALTINLSPEEIEEIESAKPFDLGFPMNVLTMNNKYETPADIWLLDQAGHFDYVQDQKPISIRHKNE